MEMERKGKERKGKEGDYGGKETEYEVNGEGGKGK
jgi:hypothetical protein